MASSMVEKAYEYLCREIRRKRIALGQAEQRQGVRPEELENLMVSIETMEWISQVVLGVKEGADSE